SGKPPSSTDKHLSMHPALRIEEHFASGRYAHGLYDRKPPLSFRVVDNATVRSVPPCRDNVSATSWQVHPGRDGSRVSPGAEQKYAQQEGNFVSAPRLRFWYRDAQRKSAFSDSEDPWLRKLSSYSGLGRELFRERKSARVTQGQLAEKAGLSTAVIRRLEAGRGNLDSWRRVLEALGLEMVGRNYPTNGSLGEAFTELR